MSWCVKTAAKGSPHQFVVPTLRVRRDAYHMCGPMDVLLLDVSRTIRIAKGMPLPRTAHVSPVAARAITIGDTRGGEATAAAAMQAPFHGPRPVPQRVSRTAPFQGTTAGSHR